MAWLGINVLRMIQNGLEGDGFRIIYLGEESKTKELPTAWKRSGVWVTDC